MKRLMFFSAAALRESLDKLAAMRYDSRRSPIRQTGRRYGMSGTWADVERSETPLFRSVTYTSAPTNMVWFFSNWSIVQFNPAQCAVITNISADSMEEFPPELRLSEGF